MNIGLSTSVIQRGKTGIAQHVLALTRAFRAHADRHRFHLFVLAEDLPLFAFAAERLNLVPVAERFRPPVKNILWHQTALVREARALRLDVLHVPSYRRLLWRRPCALVATVHDLAPFQVRQKYDWRRMFFGRVVVPRLIRRQDAIIAVSQNTANDLVVHARAPADRITVIHNGLDHEQFFPGSQEAAQAAVAQRFGLSGPFLLYVARLEHPGKNHLRLIAAFERFKRATGSPWQLVFGGSDWHGAEAIHAARNVSPFADSIRSLGFVENAVLPDLYRAAAAFIYPSLYEGFGMPPVEAMACGCPVISSTRGALGEVVGDAAMTVEPEDVDSMATAMARLAGAAEERERWRAAGLRQAAKFNWSRAAADTVGVYERAVGIGENRQKSRAIPARSAY